MNLTSHHIQILATSSEAGAQAQSHVDSVDNIFSKTHNLSWHLINNMFYQTKTTAGKCPDISAKIFTSVTTNRPEDAPERFLVLFFFFCFKTSPQLLHLFKENAATLLCCEAPEKGWHITQTSVLFSRHERRWKCPWHLISKMWFCLQKHGWKSPDISANIFSFDTTNQPENVPNFCHRFLVLTQQTKNKMSPYRGRSSGFHGWLRIDWIITFGWNIPLKP